MLAWADIARLAAALPAVDEAVHFGVPSFRVKGKSFASQGRDGPSLIIKFEPEDQANLIQLHPGVVERVAGGTREARAAAAGWSVLRYERCDEALAASLLKLAWSGVAPPRLTGAP
jgi:hypothetical protein